MLIQDVKLLFMYINYQRAKAFISPLFRKMDIQVLNVLEHRQFC